MTVWREGTYKSLVRTIVVHATKHVVLVRGPNEHTHHVTSDVPTVEEGRVWCRGWDGPAVDALKTVVALDDRLVVDVDLPTTRRYTKNEASKRLLEAGDALVPAHRHPFRGEPVSVVTSRGIMRARARGLRHPDFDMDHPPRMRVVPTKSKGNGNVRTDVALDQEGISWCRGWNGPQVNALRTIVALQSEEHPTEWEMKTVTP